MDNDTQSVITSSLVQLDKSGSYILALDAHKSYALKILRNDKSFAVGAIIKRWFDDGAPFLRRDIIISWVHRADYAILSDLKNRIGTVTPWERRAFIVASYMLGDEGKHWREAQKFDAFEKFVRDSVMGMKESELRTLS